jgi:hypothetical protein
LQPKARGLNKLVLGSETELSLVNTSRDTPEALPNVSIVGEHPTD